MGPGLLTGCHGDFSRPARLGTNVWPGYEPLYLARETGALPRDRVSLIEYTSASQVIRAFDNGALDIAAVTLDEALLLVDLGTDLQVFMALDISDGGDSIVARADIPSVASLRGKRVGVESGAAGAYVLLRALSLHGLSISDIEIIEATFDQHLTAFSSGKIDAVVTFEPATTWLRQAGAHVIFDSRQIAGEIIDVLVARTHFAQTQTALLAWLSRCWQTTLDVINSSPDQAMPILARRTKLTTKEMAQAYQGLKLTGLADNQRLFTPSGDHAAPILTLGQRLQAQLHANGLLQQLSDIAAAFAVGQQLFARTGASA